MKESDSKKPLTYSFILCGLLILTVIFLQNKIVMLESEYNSLESDNVKITNNYQNYQKKTEETISTAITPPYIYINNQNVYIAFRQSNGNVIKWFVPFTALNYDLQRGFFKREFIDEELLPLHSRYSSTLLNTLNVCFNSQITMCNNYQILMSLCGGGDAGCSSLRESFQKEQDEIAVFFTQNLAEIKKEGKEYISLENNGNAITVMDFRPFVDKVAFTNIIPQLYAEIGNDQQFIHELWYILSQLTTYSLEIKETPKFPLETLLSGGGDCEDTSILLASMLKAANKNWKISLVYMDSNNPINPKNINHVLVQVETASESFFIETTSKTQENPYDKIVGWYLEV
ncbi:hypothetical protein COV20_05375 [Candidatus Woesearchaeota archaeon CG10_big_fil_rev_8_21_14_0_10_45_16]|nr:MAG: hypothetical protein COV20_05375 [Candidatus Woesearchaeota archaeon CG10_big_fil_rev_8_21_14_0_10_45_16]